MQKRCQEQADGVLDAIDHRLTRYWCRLQLLEEDGQGLVEYGFTIVLIGVVVIGILAVVGTQIGDLFSEITTTFPGS